MSGVRKILDNHSLSAWHNLFLSANAPLIWGDFCIRKSIFTYKLKMLISIFQIKAICWIPIMINPQTPTWKYGKTLLHYLSHIMVIQLTRIHICPTKRNKVPPKIKNSENVALKLISNNNIISHYDVNLACIQRFSSFPMGIIGHNYSALP